MNDRWQAAKARNELLATSPSPRFCTAGVALLIMYANSPTLYPFGQFGVAWAIYPAELFSVHADTSI
jgi:hypothetical protein